MPTISPAWTCRDTSANSPERVSPVTSSSGGPAGTAAAGRRGGKTYSIVRPVMRLTSSLLLVVRAGRSTADVRPSLSTVTRSPISRISSMRWEM